jgi:dTDP-4-amino-4,6-dideoxygalactose transaminase
MSTTTITKVPLLDLQGQYEPIKEQVLAAFKEVFDSKQFIMGPKVEKMETEIAAYCGTKHALGVSSGTDALILALMALDIKAGDEVITSPFTFFATAGSIARVGAKPVFVDVDPDTFNINPDLIEKAITPKTKVIMPVHLFGHLADMEKIMLIAKKYKLYVIEDAAQAIGSALIKNGQELRAGSFGDIGCFSFFPSKNLGCCGDGGAVTTNDPDLYNKMKMLRVHGASATYFHKIIGGNFRLDPIQAAVISIKLPYLEDQHKGRKLNGEYYTKNLKDIVKTPVVKAGYKMIYNQYSLRTSQRDKLKQFLTDNNIGNSIYYPVPLHLQECFAYLGYKKGDLPEAEKASQEILSIPIYTELNNEQKDYVINKIKEFFVK